MSRKTPAKVRQQSELAVSQVKSVARSQVTSVSCDAVYECPDGNTCCKLSSGVWGCCPFTQAVCCSDTFCCNHGFVCDLPNQTCKPESTNQQPARAAIQPTNIMCNKQFSCRDNSTCCALEKDVYGCCPYPKAVCCSRDLCCPEGFSCDLAVSMCVKDQVKKITCDDKQTSCEDEQTCCKLPTGGYGCCPLPKATCCKDGVHCCPERYRCDLDNGTCLSGQKRLPLFAKILP